MRTHIHAFVCVSVFSETYQALKLKDYMKQQSLSGLGHQQVHPTEKTMHRQT